MQNILAHILKFTTGANYNTSLVRISLIQRTGGYEANNAKGSSRETCDLVPVSAAAKSNGTHRQQETRTCATGRLPTMYHTDVLTCTKN